MNSNKEETVVALRELGYTDEYIDKAYISIMKSCIIDQEDTEAINAIDIEAIEDEVKRIMKREAERLELQENLRKAKEAEQLAKKKELASKDYSDEITNYLVGRNIKKIHGIELANECWSGAQDFQKDEFFGNPTYFCYCMLPKSSEEAVNPLLEEAIQTCIQKLHQSVIIDEKVTKYIESNSEDRSKDAETMQKLAAMCPATVKTGNAKIDAYTYICYIEDSKECEDLRLDVNDSMIADISARLLANADIDEPLEPSMRNAVETTRFRDKIRGSFSKGTVREVFNKLNISPIKNIDGQLDYNVEKDEESKKLYNELRKEREADRERYEERLRQQEETIKNLERKINQQEQTQYQHCQQTYGTSQGLFGGNNNNFGYRSNNYYSQNQLGILGVFHLILAAFCLFIYGLTRVYLLPIAVGFILSAIGYFTHGRNKDSIRFIVCGYVVVVIAVVWLMI